MKKVGKIVFCTVALLSAYRFFRLRNVLTFFADEADNIVFGWLATAGHTLYGSVFSHHTPLAYIPAQITATLSPSDDYWHFRIFPWIFYFLTALSFVHSPFFRDSRDRGFFAGAAFLLITTLVIPAYLGNLLLVNAIWPCFFVIFLNRFFFPFLFEKKMENFDVVVGGVTLVLWVSGSLITFYPFVSCSLIFFLTLVSSPKHRNQGSTLFKRFALSSLGAVSLLSLWLLFYGDIGNFFDQCILFNVRIYSQFSGFEEKSGFLQLITGALRQWFDGVLLVALQKGITPLRPLHHGLPVYTLVLVLSTLGFLGFLCLKELSPAVNKKSVKWFYKGSIMVLFLLLILFLRMQGGGFKDLPFYIVSIGILAIMVGRLFGSSKIPNALIGFILIGLFSFPAAEYGLFHANYNQADYKDFLKTEAMGDYIASHTNPEDTIAVFPLYPVLYLEARREPAHDAIFFLPWQARWEEEFPRTMNTCEQIQKNTPKFIFIRSKKVWKKYDWKEYAACIDRFVRNNYVLAKPFEFKNRLWKIKTL